MGSVSGVAGTLDVSVVGAGAYPAEAVPIVASSNVVANASTTQNLPALVGKTTYMTGFEVTGLGATGAGSVALSIYLAGIAVALYYIVPVPAGVTVGIAPLIVEFLTPISSGAANSVIQTILPAFGAGNTAACLTVHGYQL